MKLLYDLLSLIVFFAAFRLAKAFPDATVGAVTSLVGPLDGARDLQVELAAVIVATLCAIVAAVVQIGWLLARRQSVKPALWLSAALIVVFGGLTVLLRNEWFIKLKPSILYWIFAALLLGGRLVWRRNLLGALLSEELDLPGPVWDRLLYAWSVFFVLLGCTNLAVAYVLSTDAWVNFKTFGLMGLTLAFSVASALYMARYLTDGAKGHPTPGTDV